MSETVVINPILVQAHHPDIPPVQDNPRLSEHTSDKGDQTAFERRLANQSRPGANPAGYIDLSRPDDVSTLAPEHHGAYEIARLIAAETPDAMPYFLAETALHHDRVYQDLRPLGSTALLRVEEGLTWRSFETRRELERRLETRQELGKTYVNLPGFDSPVATAGWWLDMTEPDPIKRAEQSITEIPSCEVYMSQEIEDQAFYAEAGSVIRIVPSSMEDREATAVRILRFLGTYPGMRSLSSIIVNPGGDIKKVRTWSDEPLPSGIGELIGPLKANGQVKKLVSVFSNEASRLYASSFKGLPEEVRRGMKSPNDRTGAVKDRAHRFHVFPYPRYPVTEVIKPQAGTAASLLKTAAEQFSDGDDNQMIGRPFTRHYAGKGTNNVFYVRLPLFDGKLTNGDAGEVVTHLFFSRVNGEQQSYLQSLPDIFHHDPQAFGDFLMRIETSDDGPYYMLVEGRRKAA